ncbi:hypothetical protein ACIBCN_37010 [Nocardia sp. NPDC051052]|uniref:hypothetical protein n=1 Tax=Nocardia sp. NPDC051052 TaxID=3364322 RepID=UPI0037A50AC0
MPRIVSRRTDGAAIVAVGGVCVIVEPDSVDASGRYAVAADALEVTLVNIAAVEPGFGASDGPMPDGLLAADQIAAILAWEVGFVEGVEGDAERPGLSGNEAELYLRYRPDTGDPYPDAGARSVDVAFPLELRAGPRKELVATPQRAGAAGDVDVVDEFGEPPLVTQLCASMAYLDDLSGAEIVADAAQDLIDRISYAATVTEFYPALVESVVAGTLPDEVLELAGGFDTAQILDFFARLVTELDRLRPWPDPALVSVDPATWPSLGSSVPIGWVDIHIDDLEWAVKAPFGDVVADEPPMLVLRLRDGRVVALVGEQEPEPAQFVLLLPAHADQRDSAEVIAYLARYAGLRVETEGLREAMTEMAAS